MELKETMRTSQTLYRGKVVTLRRDEVTLPDGGSSVREVVEHPGGVAIVALDEENRVMLVRQYRYVFSRTMLELPAGKREPGEPPLETAQRELREEVGATAEEWTALGTLIPSPGCYGERLYLYLARKLHFGDAQPDEDEFLTAERMPLKELYDLCMAGQIEDAKTVCGVLKVVAMGL